MNHHEFIQKSGGDFFAAGVFFQVQEPLLSKWGFDPSEEGLAEATEAMKVSMGLRGPAPRHLP